MSSETTNPNNSDHVADVASINDALRKNYLRIDTNHVDYTINDYDIANIKLAGNSIWKDVFLASIAIGIPCIINAYCEYNSMPSGQAIFNTKIFLNSLFGILGLILGAISFFVWKQNSNNLEKILSAIKNKPIYELGSK